MGVLELPLPYPILYMEGLVLSSRTNELDSEYQNSIKATWGWSEEDLLNDKD